MIHLELMAVVGAPDSWEIPQGAHKCLGMTYRAFLSPTPGLSVNQRKYLQFLMNGTPCAGTPSSAVLIVHRGQEVDANVWHEIKSPYPLESEKVTDRQVNEELLLLTSSLIPVICCLHAWEKLKSE